MGWQVTGDERMQTLEVALGERSYPIHVGNGLLQELSGLLKSIVGKQAFVVSNATVRGLYGRYLTEALGDTCEFFEMPDGESHKNLHTYGEAMDALMRGRHNRTTCVIALGGGVVGDLAGFVAATFQRGVDFVQIPTTLLAQVDSSVGGKTAVNHALGKNMIGAFYQPRAVIIDTTVLNSLPLREYRAGLAEVIKYGVIADRDFFTWLEDHTEQINKKSHAELTAAIVRSCRIKAEVVSEDEREAGRRAILNYGHTFGHAIENLSGYGKLLHGEAVAVGMLMAARFSERLNLLAQGTSGRLRNLIEAFELPTGLVQPIPCDDFLDAMGMDKKVVAGRMRFVLAHDIGRVEVTDQYADAALEETIEEFNSAV